MIEECRGCFLVGDVLDVGEHEGSGRILWMNAVGPILRVRPASSDRRKKTRSARMGRIRTATARQAPIGPTIVSGADAKTPAYCRLET